MELSTKFFKITLWDTGTKTMQRLNLIFLNKNVWSTEIEIWPGPSYFISDLALLVQVEGNELITHTLYVDAFEVTNRLYKACVTKDGNDGWQREEPARCKEPEDISSLDVPEYYYIPDHQNSPMVNVDFFSALNYCEGAGKSLLTVEEWEHIAEAVYSAPFSCPKLEDKEPLKPVGNFPADSGENGIKDLFCNAQEWIQYAENTPKSCAPPYDRCTENKEFCNCPKRGASPYRAGQTIAKEALDEKTASGNFRPADGKATESFAKLGFRCVYKEGNPANLLEPSQRVNQ